MFTCFIGWMLAMSSLRYGNHPRVVKYRELLRSDRSPGLEIGCVLSAPTQEGSALISVIPVTTEHLLSR